LFLYSFKNVDQNFSFILYIILHSTCELGIILLYFWRHFFYDVYFAKVLLMTTEHKHFWHILTTYSASQHLTGRLSCISLHIRWSNYQQNQATYLYAAGNDYCYVTHINKAKNILLIITWNILTPKKQLWIMHFWNPTMWHHLYFLLFAAVASHGTCVVHQAFKACWLHDAPISLTSNNCTLCLCCSYVLYIYLRTNSDLCHLHHKLIGFYNRDEKCLLCTTDWLFK
jgi:hypothetical protein